MAGLLAVGALLTCTRAAGAPSAVPAEASRGAHAGERATTDAREIWLEARPWTCVHEIGHDAAAGTVPAPFVAPDDELIERERTIRLYRALDRIEPLKRLTLTLADLEELPASQVARILEIPEPTVRSRLRVARQELHGILKRDPLFGMEAAR